jgi:catechol-2,3-dioxygenase
MARVVGLGHVGIYCWDLKKMTDFYQHFMGMQLTKQNWQRGMIFLSTDPERSDHEIALMAGRPEGEQPHLIDQISMRVETLDDLRDFVRRIRAAGLKIHEIVSHCSAVGCYFFDPEGNRTEVFWLTGRPCWVPALKPVDVEHLSDEQVMDIVDEQWARLKHVQPGEVLEPAMAVPG